MGFLTKSFCQKIFPWSPYYEKNIKMMIINALIVYLIDFRNQCFLMKRNGSKDYWLHTLMIKMITYLFATKFCQFANYQRKLETKTTFILCISCPSCIRSPLKARSEYSFNIHSFNWKESQVLAMMSSCRNEISKICVS